MQLSLKGAAMDTFIKHLSAHCSNDLIERWKALKNRLNKSENVVVANAGLFKAGKSSLFNALFESIGTERFPTGAAPVTHALDQQEWLNDILLVDTPGIGAQDADEMQAIQSYRLADVILFVHNLRMGDYQKEECNFISRIKNEFAGSNIRERFLFVGSRLDEVQGTSDEHEILKRMKEQLKQIFGFEMPIYVESATRYMKGKRENKNGLINSSGFSELRTEILRRASVAGLSKDASLNHELSTLQRDTVAILRPVYENYQGDIQRTESAVNAKISDAIASLNKFFDNYRVRFNMIIEKQKHC